VTAAVGIEPEAIRTIARDFARSPTACAYGRIGTCQNEFGPVANWLVEILNVVTGNLDRAGGAMFPAAPADIAPLGRLLIGNNVGRWRSRVRGLPEFLGSLPSAVMAEEMETEGEGQIRALVTYAGNPVLSIPNGDRLSRAIEKLDLSVSFDFYVNETNRLADYILPPAHVFEVGNFDVLILRFAVRNIAKYSPPILPRAPNARDDWEIASDLVARLHLPGLPGVRRSLMKLTHDLPERVVDLLLRVGPRRLTLRQLAEAPNGLDFGPMMPRGRECIRTPDGRARLTPRELVADLARVDAWLDKASDGELLLVGRRHLRSNNSWMHNVTSLVKGPDRSKLMMHPTDAARLGLSEGTEVSVKSRVGEVRTTLSISKDMMLGVVSLPHGYGHASLAGSTNVAAKTKGPSANSLTDERMIEPLVGTSILNGVPVTVSAA
jgi:anaerobic selenocysteine-containing dehydrogenase